MTILFLAKIFHPPLANGLSAYMFGLLQAFTYWLNKNKRYENISVFSSIDYELLKMRGKYESVIFDKYIVHNNFISKIIYYDKAITNKHNILVDVFLEFTYTKNYVGNNLKTVNIISPTYTEYLVSPLAFSLNTNTINFFSISYSGRRHNNKFLLHASRIFLNKRKSNNLKINFILSSESIYDNLYKNIRKSNNIRNYIKILPPVIDTEIFRKLNKIEYRRDLFLKTVSKILGLDREEEEVISSFDYIILYTGFATPHRFPLYSLLKLLHYAKINHEAKIGALVVLKGSSALKLDIIKHFIELFNISDRILIKYKYLDLNDKILLYNISDLLVYFFDPFIISPPMVDPSITVLEALSCGLPVLTVDALDTGRVVSRYRAGGVIDYNSFLHGMPTYYYTRFYSKVFDILNNKKKYSVNARLAAISNFNKHIIAKRLNDIVEP